MKRLAAITMIMLLSACGTTPEVYEAPPQLITYANKVNCYPPNVSPVEMKEVSPRSIKDAQGNPGVHLSPEDYNNLRENMVDIKRWMLGMKSVEGYYQKCIEDFNKNVDELENPQPQEDKRSLLNKLLN